MRLAGICEIFSALLLLGSAIPLQAQPPCASNPLASDYCMDATPICNLNGYCGNTSATYTPYVSPTNQTNETFTPLGAVFCANIQNNSWLKFIADSTVAVFNVWVDNCLNGMGIQMQIYSTNDCYNFVPVSNCWNPAIPVNGTILATGLIPGNAYYFMIDGTGGDVCDYVIACSSGVSTSPTITPGQIICKGASSSLQVNGALTCHWTSDPPDPSLNGQTANSSVTVSPMVTTVYSATVTMPGLNSFCTNSVEILRDTVTVVSLSASVTAHTDAGCGQNNGTAVVQASGGVGNYSYLWNTNPPQFSNIAINLAPGTWTVTVSANNCDTVCSVTILDHPGPEASIGEVVQPTCGGMNGQVTVQVSGGTPPYLLVWNSTPAQYSQTLQSVPSGNYTVTVTDALNCSTIQTVVLQGSNAVEIEIASVTNADCGSGPGSATVTPLAGQSPFEYLWNTTPEQTTATAFDLFPGTYSVTVTDSNGCTAQATATVNLDHPLVLTMSSSGEHCRQGDGSATVVVTGGDGDYAYLWDNGQTGQSAVGLISGIYYVTVSDEWCKGSASVVVDSLPGPVAAFSENPRIIRLIDQTRVFFMDESTGDIVSRLWILGDGFSTSLPHFSHQFADTGICSVTLIVTDASHCSDTVTDRVIVRDYLTLYVPDSFTPDGDGINDFFYCSGTNIDPFLFEMDIFDRWGNLVFHTNEWNGTHSAAWNGSIGNSGHPQSPETEAYAYVIRVREKEGLIHRYTGRIVLIR